MIYLVTVDHSDIQEKGKFEGQLERRVGVN